MLRVKCDHFNISLCGIIKALSINGNTCDVIHLYAYWRLPLLRSNTETRCNALWIASACVGNGNHHEIHKTFSTTSQPSSFYQTEFRHTTWQAALVTSVESVILKPSALPSS